MRSQLWRLGGELRQARLARGLSLREVARRVGVDESTLSKIERARLIGPSRDQVQAIGVALGLGDQAMEALHSVAAHDRCLRTFMNEQMSERVLRLASLVLQAGTLLDDSDQDRIIGLVAGAVQGVSRLRRAAGDPEEGNAMT